mmetsp:Transcript_38522/g.123477  ORF Transcript_38522/g.123477 Transcript_38522/m.123477 type:complete len:296 (+) Transcript_38522:64-951(+)|eukprot:CAMPEP_0118904354 /NCGR_PEP_ID=MMETSP1166-20130328/8856_1 /TAXON_ID=1104430 /ORGANISM="Chrysoreinhardia sp, Strain CCMP3193" /LENGTH=295 /DNA_ID=CAMNT_0006843611 /DNA_START=50 /DNA_END=937 /DNA_ORIENTATION=+
MSVKQAKLPLQYEVVCAAAAGTCVVFVTNPFEVVKTRLQLEGEGVAGKLRPANPLARLVAIARAEGLRGMQAGLLSGILYQQAMNGTRLGGYDLAKSALSWVPVAGLQSALAGALTGCAGAFVASPFYQIKVRLQSNQIEANLLGGLAAVVRDEGFGGLFRGANGAVIRVAMGSAAQLSSYDTCKQLIHQYLHLDGTPLHLASSLSASVFVILVMNPFDVVSTRLYSAPPGKFRGVAHCFTAALRHEGIPGLYKGSPANYLRLGPHTILTLMAWEKFKGLAKEHLAPDRRDDERL